MSRAAAPTQGDKCGDPKWDNDTFPCGDGGPKFTSYLSTGRTEPLDGRHDEHRQHDEATPRRQGRGRVRGRSSHRRSERAKGCHSIREQTLYSFAQLRPRRSGSLPSERQGPVAQSRRRLGGGGRGGGTRVSFGRDHVRATRRRARRDSAGGQRRQDSGKRSRRSSRSHRTRGGRNDASRDALPLRGFDEQALLRRHPRHDTVHGERGTADSAFRAARRGSSRGTLSAPLVDKRDGVLAISPVSDGPLNVRGNVEICSGTGRTVARTKRAAICRCGGSENKPFCDGTHAKIGFRTG